ncbi:hypothetical protein [Butyricimonas synergistica]|uniref:hypothetical protein n=1 Tax=Butyricimonas synergistica TaxID=544644 RepID=UPI0022E51E50|nr:hypothetical protein [Butyricimonas synergistica]
MKKILFVSCVACLMIGCGSKKKFIQSGTKENFLMNEQLYAEFYRTTRLLEFLDIEIRQVETRDSSGNVRTETNVDINKKTDRQDLDTTKVTINKQEKGEKVVKTEVEEERSGVMEAWVWIVGFLALIVVALVMGVYILKK